MSTGIDDVPGQEELDDYRATARAWLRANMAPISQAVPYHDASNQHLKDLAKRLFEGGYSGICYPTELDGAGLTRSHHRVFCEEAAGYELPEFLGNPGLSIIGPPILEFGTDEQKQHIAAMLRGERVFAQLMSEPSGGSNMAGALTRGDRDGDSWVINGSKVWSSGAHRSDWGLMLVRTDWDVPKHQGLSMFLLDLSLPGIEIQKIRMIDGSDEFCQEYFDDVLVPHSCLLGKANDGWTVAQRLLFHERNAVGGGSPYDYNRPRGEHGGLRGISIAALSRESGRTGDSRVVELVGEAHANDVVADQLIRRVTTSIETGRLPAIAGSLLRLNSGVTNTRRASIALEVVGRDGITWEPGGASDAVDLFLSRQTSCIGGGTTEMQRNLISERLMGMPREPAADKDKPFNEVPH